MGRCLLSWVPMRTWVVALALVAGACSSSPSPDGGADAGSDAGLPPADGGFSPDAAQPIDASFLTVLSTPEQLAAMTSTAGGGVKYLAHVAGRPAFEPLTEPCYFQNMRRFSWHLLFLQSFPEHRQLSYDAYLALVLRQSARRLWGGAVQAWPGALHPRTNALGVVAYTIYGEPNSFDASAVVEVDRVLKSCVPFARELLVWVPESPDQRGLLTRDRGALAAMGVDTLFPESLVEGVPHLPYSEGEAYGTLRLVPEGQPLTEYGPRDVVIVESAPNDISLVSGLITRNPQNALGHVNLRLREKRVPNLAVPKIYEAAWAKALDGHLVHLVVTQQKFVLEPATLEDAEAYWEAHRPHVRTPVADLTVTALESFATLRAAGARAYGAKAANLGELHAVLDAPNRNDGFGIPFARYRDFAAGLGIEAMIADPRMKSDAAYKRTTLKAVRERIEDAPFPPALLATITQTILSVYGEAGRTQRLRFRSSTNVEDLDAFTGAGLYESKSGCLADDEDGDAAGPSRCLRADERVELERQLAAYRADLAAHPERTWLADLIDDIEGDITNERSIARAVRKTWASLWNERAYDEREYYGIDHRLAYMGIAVNPSFVLERASAVAVSNLKVDEGDPVYRLNSQIGSESVVRPEDPTAVAELITFRRTGDQVADIRVLVSSNRLPEGQQVWPPEKLAEVGRLLFRVHDHFAADVYRDLSPLHLDFELKHSAEGDVVIKQVRPFVSGEP